MGTGTLTVVFPSALGKSLNISISFPPSVRWGKHHLLSCFNEGAVRIKEVDLAICSEGKIHSCCYCCNVDLVMIMWTKFICKAGSLKIIRVSVCTVLYSGGSSLHSVQSYPLLWSWMCSYPTLLVTVVGQKVCVPTPSPSRSCKGSSGAPWLWLYQTHVWKCTVLIAPYSLLSHIKRNVTLDPVAFSDPCCTRNLLSGTDHQFANCISTQWHSTKRNKAIKLYNSSLYMSCWFLYCTLIFIHI